MTRNQKTVDPLKKQFNPCDMEKCVGTDRGGIHKDLDCVSHQKHHTMTGPAAHTGPHHIRVPVLGRSSGQSQIRCNEELPDTAEEIY